MGYRNFGKTLIIIGVCVLVAPAALLFLTIYGRDFVSSEIALFTFMLLIFWKWVLLLGAACIVVGIYLRSKYRNPEVQVSDWGSKVKMSVCILLVPLALIIMYVIASS